MEDWLAPTAVCLTGHLSGASPPVEDRGAGITRHLLRPLQGEAHLVLTHDRTSSPRDIRAELQALHPVASVLQAPDATSRFLSQKLHMLRHWPRVLAAFHGSPTNSSCYARLDEQRTVAGFRCVVKRFRRNGELQGLPVVDNTFLAPVLGASKLHNLQKLYALSRCLGQLTAHEVARSLQYEYVAYSRLDMVWLGDHPPLHLLKGDHVWAPLGQDYEGGLNDRHGVVSRAGADIVMRCVIQACLECVGCLCAAFVTRPPQHTAGGWTTFWTEGCPRYRCRSVKAPGCGYRPGDGTI